MNITFGGMFMISERISLMLVLLVGMAGSACAQSDDMYFVPKKVKKMYVEPRQPAADRPAYYVGSDRDVDEYNRRGRFRSSYTPVTADSLQNDVIDFSAGTGVYPDSLGLDSTKTFSHRGTSDPGYDDGEDYRYCRRMQMFDGWYDPWYYGYCNFYGPYWGGWYDSWYGYAGWYGPWGWNYYGYGWPYYSSAWYWGWGAYPYGWGYPYYAWSRPAVAYRPGPAGTLRYYDRSNYVGGTRIDRGNAKGYTDGGYGRRSANIVMGRRRNTTIDNGRTDTFTESRPAQPSFGGSRSYGSFGGGGSFGGAMGGSRGGGAGIGGGGVRMGRR